MKVIARMMAVVMSVVMMGMAFTACSAEKDIVGDWTVKTINGKTVEETASAAGVDASMVTLNFKFEKDKATLTGIAGSKEFQVSYKSNGVMLQQNGADIGSVIYDKSAQTLTMKDNATGTVIDYVFEKGTFDFSAASAAQPDAQATPDDQAESDDQPAQTPEDQGEDTGAEDAGEDYADEEAA